jgi:hypothetical protein
MLHACVERFDVMGGRGNILGWDGEVNKALVLLDGWMGCHSTSESFQPRPCLDAKCSPKFHYIKRRFLITSKCRHMHGILNVDEIKN